MNPTLIEPEPKLSRLTIRRLKTLIAFMRALPRSAAKHFDMTAWIRPGGEHEFGTFIRPADLQTCGTTACALGWAAVVPSFRRAGLKVWARRYDIIDRDSVNNAPIGKAFFGINDEQFRHLFGGGYEMSSPKEWARKAEQFLKSHGVAL